MVYRRIRKYRKFRRRIRRFKRRRKSRVKSMYRIAKQVLNRSLETKTIDVEYNNILNQTGDYWVPVVPWHRNNSGIYQYHLEVPQGTGDSDRIGRKIKLTGVMVDVVFYLASNQGGAAGSQQQCRFFSGFMTAAGDSNAGQQQLNTANAFFKKLDSAYTVTKKDVKITLDTNPLNQGELVQYRYKKFIRLSQTLEYDISDTPTSYKGVPIICMISERPMSTGINVSVRGYVRYYFQDP